MTRRIASVLGLLACLPGAASGSSPPSERGIFARETGEGRIVAVGYADGQGEDVYLMLAGPEGEVVWERRFGGPGDDWGWWVGETAAGFVVAGSTTSRGEGGFDCLLMEVGRDGQELWNATVGGPGEDRCWAAIPDGEGWVLVGETRQGPKGTEDCFVGALGPGGEKRWTSIFGGKAGDRCFSIAASGSGWIVAGQTFSRGAGDRDFWVAGLDSGGRPTWQKTWGGEDSDVAHWIEPTADGNFVVTGYTTSLAGSGDDPFVVKIDPAGEEIWARVVPFDGVVHTITGAERAGGGFCLTGFEDTTAGRRAIVVWLDAEGDDARKVTLADGAEAAGYTIQPLDDGNCLATGYVVTGRGVTDILLQRVTPPLPSPADLEPNP